MPPDDPRGPADRDLQPDRGDPSGPSADPFARRARVQVFEAHSDGQGEWRLDSSASSGRAGSGWAGRIKQFLLVTLSLAVAATLWLFAFALLLVLLPLVALAGWYMWRRLKSMQRAHMARHRGGNPF